MLPSASQDELFHSKPLKPCALDDGGRLDGEFIKTFPPESKFLALLKFFIQRHILSHRYT
jgi:hypothetical protein